jgi:hypothetical protein
MPTDYIRSHIEHAASTRGLRSADPDNETRRTQEMPVVTPAREWRPEALDRLLSDLERR